MDPDLKIGVRNTLFLCNREKALSNVHCTRLHSDSSAQIPVLGDFCGAAISKGRTEVGMSLNNKRLDQTEQCSSYTLNFFFNSIKKISVNTGGST
jgi:hypothetical protein